MEENSRRGRCGFSRGCRQVSHNFKQIVLGGRIPSFARYLRQYCKKNSVSVISDEERDRIAEHYIQATTRRWHPLDPEISFYQKVGVKISGNPKGQGIFV